MKKYFLTALLSMLLFPFFSFSQEKEREPNRIESGLYIKLGPSFPMGVYATGQVLKDASEKDSSYYFPATMGGTMDMGYLIYIGPAFANNHLRAGIDATFISFSFNSIKSDTITGSKTKYWYYFIGQKFGPVISVCPVDRLVIDISYKMNAYAAYVHHRIRGKENDEFGMNLTQNEISMTIRYTIMLFSFQYNFGQVAYNDFDGAKPIHYIDNTTFRILIGFKF